MALSLRSRIALLLPLRSILFILCFISLSLVSGQQISFFSRWWSIIVSLLNIITIALLVLLCKRENTTYLELIRYKKGSTKVSEIIFISVAVLVIGMSGMFLAGVIIYGEFPYLAVALIQPIPLGLAIANAFILPITTTLAEDGLYLGYAINRINGKWAAILLPAFFYAAQHSFIPVFLSSQYILYRFLSFLPLTLLMCYWYYSKRNPVPLMVGHFIINLATVSQIIMSSAFPHLVGIG